MVLPTSAPVTANREIIRYRERGDQNAGSLCPSRPTAGVLATREHTRSADMRSSNGADGRRRSGAEFGAFTQSLVVDRTRCQTRRSETGMGSWSDSDRKSSMSDVRTVEAVLAAMTTI